MYDYDIVQKAGIAAIKLLRRETNQIIFGDQIDMIEQRIANPEIYRTEKINSKQLISRARAARRKELEEYWDPKIAFWALKNLRPDNIVKFKGTRDGGYRKVIEVFPNSIECTKLDERFITQHGPEKLTHVMIDGCIGESLESIKDIIRREDGNEHTL